MATTKLRIPANNNKVEIVDITTVTAPVLGTPVTLATATKAQAIAVDSAGNYFVADKTAGRVYKFDQTNAPLLDVAIIQSGQGPNSLVVDEDDDVWAFFANGTDTLKLSNATLGTLATVTTVLGDLVGVGVSDTYLAVEAFDRTTAKLYRISTSSNTLSNTLDIPTLLTGTTADQVSQIASAGDKVYVAYKHTATLKYRLAVIDLDTNSAVNGDVMDVAKTLALYTDGTFVYASDAQNKIYKYSLTGGLLAVFTVTAANGAITGLATGNDLAHLIAVDDGFFPGKMSYHIVNVNTGITVFSQELTNSSAGRILGCDLTGFQRLNNIEVVVVPAPSPTIDIDKIFALVHESGRISVVGLPGAVSQTSTIDVELPIATTVISGIVPDVNGAFSAYTAVLVGDFAGFETLRIEATGPGGTVTADTQTIPLARRLADQIAFEEESAAALAELLGRPVDILGVDRRLITDFDSWGGYVARRLQDIYRLVACLQHHISVFKDIRIEGINVQSDTTYVFQGDSPTIKFIVLDSRGVSPLDIDGADIVFKVYDALQGNILIFQKDVTITSGAFGACEVTLSPTDTASAGEFYGILRVTFPGGELASTPRFIFVIAPAP